MKYDTHQVFRHDLAGWRRESSPTRPSGNPVVLRPDWVCEILSPSNRANDTFKKHRVLQAHGVPHHWVLDADARTLTVFRHGPDGDIAVLVAGGEDPFRAEPFDAVELSMRAVLGEDA